MTLRSAPARAGSLVRRPRWLTDRHLTVLRWVLSALWLVLFGRECFVYGVPFDREGLLLWIATGVAAFTVGRRSLVAVALDFLPFAAVLVVYDYLRGLSSTLGMPTWWHPQLDLDRALFAGHEPTVWLQEHLKYEQVRWWDVVVSVCYYSFFLLPYVVAGVMWLRSRRDFYRWTLRFVSLSFAGFALFALIPAAPPWAAARCSAADVGGHPSNPDCLYYASSADGGILGPFTMHRPGTYPVVERTAGRGFVELHLGVAHTLWTKGFSVADAVAAVPSLHLGGTLLFVLFMWGRLSRWWRPLLVVYPLAMTFSLVYSAEHYVTDCLAGALLAIVVHLAANRLERRRSGAGPTDTLGPPVESAASSRAEPKQESSCPPAQRPTSATPSST